MTYGQREAPAECVNWYHTLHYLSIAFRPPARAVIHMALLSSTRCTVRILFLLSGPAAVWSAPAIARTTPEGQSRVTEIKHRARNIAHHPMAAVLRQCCCFVGLRTAFWAIVQEGMSQACAVAMPIACHPLRKHPTPHTHAAGQARRVEWYHTLRVSLVICGETHRYTAPHGWRRRGWQPTWATGRWNVADHTLPGVCPLRRRRAHLRIHLESLFGTLRGP